MNIRERTLRESFGYNGYNFWENYILSELTRTFSKDAKKYGLSEALEMYSLLYGKESEPIFEEMSSSLKLLNEVSNYNGLLYEGYLLNETLELSVGNGGSMSSRKLAGIDSYYSKGSTGFNPSKIASGMVGFLKGIWDKAKSFGGLLFTKIKPAIASGVSWVKNLLQKGADFVSSSPIAQVALPILALTGSIAVAKKIINGIRKRAKKKTLSPEEEKKLQQIAKNKEDKINLMRKQIDKKQVNL
jgi:hypothetical protein